MMEWGTRHLVGVPNKRAKERREFVLFYASPNRLRRTLKLPIDEGLVKSKKSGDRMRGAPSCKYPGDTGGGGRFAL
jgi:hypothetical protein